MIYSAPQWLKTPVANKSIWNTLKEKNPTIIVVDNNSDNDEAGILQSKYGESITVLRSPHNYGYAKGNNLGISCAISLGLKYICLLNNDTRVRENFFAELMYYLDTHPEVAFISPAIVSDKMEVQSTGGKISPLVGTPRYFNHNVPFASIRNKEIRCEILSGACILFKSNYIEKLGYIPEAYFLFYEETEWCYQAKKKGYVCASLASHYIEHKSSASIRRTNGLQEYLMERNRVVFSKRNATTLGFLFFLFYDLCRTIYQGVFEGKSALKLFRYHVDGLLGKIDKRFPFIWIN